MSHFKRTENSGFDRKASDELAQQNRINAAFCGEELNRIDSVIKIVNPLKKNRIQMPCGPTPN